MSVNKRLFTRILPGLAAALALMGAMRSFASPAQATGKSLAEPPVYLPEIFDLHDDIPPLGEYIVLGWNDLGMHCYNRDFKDLAVLPPYNTLWAQVIRRGDPPQIVTEGITVEYSFPNNTTSVGKSNFWEYDLALFGVDLPADIGLTGKGLAGEMDLAGDHFAADGIPLTEFDDGSTIPQPYQLAEIVVLDASRNELARNTVVAPVSTEMHCDYCHVDGFEGISTGSIEQNILTLHDEENQDKYPAGHTTPLMQRRPVLCAECHSSNALGAAGVSGIPSLSNAMHEKHKGESPDSTEGCYNCHPGPATKCLRDVMSSQYDMGCVDCHGGMETVSQNLNPWLNEPRCDDCHTEPQYAQDQPLYRMSKGHGGLYCEACHDSTHAIAESSQERDAIKFINLQGHAGTLDTCTVCHLTRPDGATPHE
ncbi:MAG: cytochrome c3 family protein [Chloroflexi bacterium]|nr:cytochrome c3 family protein [Chloroflexota bacterium]